MGFLCIMKSDDDFEGLVFFCIFVWNVMKVEVNIVWVEFGSFMSIFFCVLFFGCNDY